jgi:formylglycine-generating enzyme required for sulfatase activity
MDQKSKEIITNKTSLTTQPGGLASRGLQIANKLSEQNSKPVKQFIEEHCFTNSIGMKFRLIPAGKFIMGSPKTEEDLDHDEEQHEVTITKAFWMGVNQVTQMQYKKVMGNNPSFNQGNKVQGDSSNHPVEMVSWNEALEFCKRLSKRPKEKKAGRLYRLSTEAEWEYACRAGTKTTYSFGESSQSLGDYAWFGNNSGRKELDSDALWAKMKNNPQEYADTISSVSCATHPVGEKKPNSWGLYDMHGNVWEWCSDWYGEYPKSAVSDPSGPNEGSSRVYRGGCWILGGEFCRSALRNWSTPSIRHNNLGFRVALSSCGMPQSPEADK